MSLTLELDASFGKFLELGDSLVGEEAVMGDVSKALNAMGNIR